MPDRQKKNLINQYLAQQLIKTVAALLESEVGRTQLADALSEQWPQDCGQPSQSAIDQTLDDLAQQKMLEMVVVLVPRLEFMRKFGTLADEKAVSHLTVTKDGNPAFLLIGNLTPDQTIHATVDAIVSEISATAVVNNVLVDHARLRDLMEAIAFKYAHDMLRHFIHAER